MANLTLKIAMATQPHTAGIKSGSFPIEGIDPQFIEVTPIIGAFRRMVRNLEFDVCEMAPTTYLIARSRGAPFIALPIFLHRQFHHEGIVCRRGSGISGPKDLETKKVGVRAYSVTTGVWKRGIMAAEYGLDCSKVTWLVDDEEAVPQLKLPANVVRAPVGKSLVNLFSEGLLDAAFTGPAGIGRQGPPSVNWIVAESPERNDVLSYSLFTDAWRQATAFYRHTGIYPFHGLLVIKESILAEWPWVAQSLFNALSVAKSPVLAALRSKEITDSETERYGQLAQVVGEDPLPYGVEVNLPSINALSSYAFEQGLLPEIPSLERAFVVLN